MTLNELQVPDKDALASVQALCDIKGPHSSHLSDTSLDALFVEAMRQSVLWHQSRSPFYARLLASRAFDPTLLRSIEDCARIPFVMASFFKSHEVLSVPKDRITLHLTSSGTTGLKSQIFFDEWSIGAPQRMLDRIFEVNGWVTPDQATNYLLYTYETDANSRLGTSYTDNYLCKYAPAREVFTALRALKRSEKTTHEFDVFGCIETLRSYEAQGFPVRIFGFPAFLHFTLQRMREMRLSPLRLSQDSLVFLGGGWKSHADQAIDKRELYRLINEQLGIPDARLRDGFGSVEHCIPYVECKNHEFHVPIWSRVFVRDVRTLEPVGFGKKGFLNFVSPYITSVPAQSVLMGDLASLHPATQCGCGLPTPYFVVHGRAGTSKNKSCAVAAAELIARNPGAA